MREDRPSRTALQVALAIPYTAHHPRWGGLLPADLVSATEDLLLASGTVQQHKIERMQRSWYRLMGGLAERLTVPGLTLHLALRKRWVGDEVEAAIADGTRQVLVVGAGLDTLGYRLAPRHPDVRFVEIDHPASQGMKRTALGRLGQSPNHHLVSADFSQSDLVTVVRNIGGWQTDEPAVLVAEGLLMYLSDNDVASFFDGTAKVVGEGSRVVISYLQRTSSGRFLLGPYGRLAEMAIKLQGEPWEWGIRAEKLADFLAPHGWTLADPQRFDLKRRYLEPSGLGGETLSGVECLAVAVR